MKFNFLSVRILALVLFGSLTVINCDNEETTEPVEESLDISELELSAEIDNVSTVIGDIVISSFESFQNIDNGRIRQHQHGLPDCVTITRVIQQGFREVTIDFGEEGCRIHGHLLKGQLVYSYTRNPEAREIIITYNTLDFYFDEKSVDGSKTILKELNNDNGNPQFTQTLNLSVTWPNGKYALREGIRVKEWIEGAFTGIFSDNVFEVTGNWKTTFRNGNSNTYKVIEPLRREVICLFFVSGSVDVQRTNFGGILDYGQGDCDNMATFTQNNGNVSDIILD